MKRHVLRWTCLFCVWLPPWGCAHRRVSERNRRRRLLARRLKLSAGGATFPHRGRLGTHAPSVAAMTALIVCMRFSASWNTMDCGPLKTSSVTSMASRSNFSPISLPTAVLWSW